MKLGLMVAALCVPKPVSVLDAMGMDAICADRPENARNAVAADAWMMETIAMSDTRPTCWRDGSCPTPVRCYLANQCLKTKDANGDG